MVDIIYVVVIGLGAGFLIPLVGQIGNAGGSDGQGPGNVAASALFYLALAAIAAIPASWLLPLASGAQAAEVFTAGFRPPLSINLRMGLLEGFVLTVVNTVALVSALTAHRVLSRRGPVSFVLVLMIVLGANGLVLTRDLFNAFVFLEILSIGTYGIIALDDTHKQYAAGFKYLIAGGLSSILFLLGTVYLYRLTGTLNIDGMIEAVEAGALATGHAAGSSPASGLRGILAVGATFTAPFLLFAGLLIELKPFPANGWALDTYEAANPAVGALVSAVNATAVVMVLHRLLPIFPDAVAGLIPWIGLVTFSVSNLVGLRQRDTRRMLGYSSVAQIGLVAATLALVTDLGMGTFSVALVAGGLLVTHIVAKAGLFWIAGAARGGEEARRGSPGIGPVAGVGAVVLGLALVGMPPFPGFWAKWQLVHSLIAGDRMALLVLLLAGTLFEALYIFRWVGTLIARPGESPDEAADGVASRAPDRASIPAARNGIASPLLRVGVAAGVGLVLGVVFLATAGVFSGWTLGLNDRLVWTPFFFAAALLLLEWLPSRVKAILAIGAVGAYAWLLYPHVAGIALVLGAVFAAGAITAIVASLARRRAPFGTYTLFVLAGTSLTGLTIASEPIAFFLLWELMTIGSYLLIARSSRAVEPSRSSDIAARAVRGEGPGAPRAALRFLGFSMAAALLLMSGLIVASHATLRAGGGAVASAVDGETSDVVLPELLGADAYVQLPLLGASGSTFRLGDHASDADRASEATDQAGDGEDGTWSRGIPARTGTAIFVLLGLAFLIKMGAMGLHIWLPDAYAEADDEATAFLSSALSKAGLLGVVVLVLMVGGPMLAAGRGATTDFAAGTGTTILGWIGVVTALLGAILAVLQEDVKKLLAYSSLSQVGYMVLGIALATHLGWVAGIYNAVNHFIFKGLLFLGMSGVILRTGTRNMWEMGGLIKRMPLTFISVLMAIIALSGVPPLSGFGGKWLIYGALLESEWYVQAGLAFFASTVAFLYLFRMIYTVFLGQLKDNLRDVREAPAAVLAPQLVLMAGLMAISMYPNLILDPIMRGVEAYLGSSVRWDEMTVVTALGYWNGNAVMWVTMGVFMLPLAWLVIVMRRPQKVKQFNIVYAAERPERPETTHFGHNFFAPYRKALGFLASPLAKRAWEYATNGVNAVAGAVRQLYTGNGQTYALHILLLTVALYFIAGGLR